MQTQSTTYPDPALQAYIEAFIEDFMRTVLPELVAEELQKYGIEDDLAARKAALLERAQRVEAELKALREAEIVDFAAIQKEMAIRFEAMTRRNAAHSSPSGKK